MPKSDPLEDVMMSIMETRLLRLNRLIGTKTLSDFGEFHSIDPTYLSQLRNKTRPFGEKAARQIELSIGLDIGYLDTTE